MVGKCTITNWKCLTICHFWREIKWRTVLQICFRCFVLSEHVISIHKYLQCRFSVKSISEKLKDQTQYYLRWSNHFQNMNRIQRPYIFTWNHTVWKLQNFYCHHLFAKIPWNQLFAEELYSKLIWRKSICMAVNFSS